MPEWAEVKLMSDMVNSVSSSLEFDKITVNPKTKQEKNFSRVEGPFNLEAETRGKEFRLKFHTKETTHELIMGMGMSGGWNISKSENADQVKHAMIQFEGTREANEKRYTLSFVDVRRFAKWKWGTYSTARGKDPVREYDDWINDLKLLMKKRPKKFEKSIYQILMDQNLFNGVGNYLRAVILHEIDANPFQTAKDYIDEVGLETLCSMCKTTMMTAYELGGGSFKSWKNPMGYKTMDASFYYPYSQGNQIKVAGRVFWYDPKWEEDKKSYLKS